MTLRYEINPPKIIPNSSLSEEQSQELLKNVMTRVDEISNFCDGIHFTDSVLGIPRVSPVVTGEIVRRINQKIEITVSLRVRDKNLVSLTQLMEDAIAAKLNGVLILKGDASPNEISESGLIPSMIVENFKKLGFEKKIDLYLSLPSNPNFDKNLKKIQANPKGFITQVISSLDEVSKISDYLTPKNFKIIPCILIPSEKNAKSAQLLKLDWSEYKNSVSDFIKNVQKITGDVLITSPNDFKLAKEILSTL